MLLVAGGSFAVAQFISSNYLDYAPTDVLPSLTALVATLGFLRNWAPAPDAEFAMRAVPITARPVGADVVTGRPASAVPGWQGWVPWIVVSVVVILWTHLKIFAIGQQNIAWPGLHNQVLITQYNDKVYAAVWAFQPLATGTAILLSAVITAAFVGPGRFVGCIGRPRGMPASPSSRSR